MLMIACIAALVCVFCFFMFKFIGEGAMGVRGILGDISIALVLTALIGLALVLVVLAPVTILSAWTDEDTITVERVGISDGSAMTMGKKAVKIEQDGVTYKVSREDIKIVEGDGDEAYLEMREGVSSLTLLGMVHTELRVPVGDEELVRGLSPIAGVGEDDGQEEE